MNKITLENQDICLEILPSCGGKIHTLTSKSTGRQWLWHNPVIPLRKPCYGDSYIKQLDNGGWDEIFPSVSPCTVNLSGGKEFNVPDHGDIVSLPVSFEQLDSRTLVTTTRGKSADFEFIRTIRIYDHILELTYNVTNLENEAFPFLWCAHPLLTMEAGMQIDFDCSVPFIVEAAFGEAPFAKGEKIQWSGSRYSNKIPSPADPDFSPFALKLFSEADTVQSVSVLSPETQEKLVFTWDTQIARYLGVWLNYGAWCGTDHEKSFCLGVEPSTSPFDDLNQAIENQSVLTLKPGESKEWFVEVAISSMQKSDRLYESLRSKRLINK